MHAWPILLVSLLIAADDSVPVRETWPQWRGPTGDSVSPVRDLPPRWTTTENVVWKAALPGWATSTPAIWQDTMFVTTQDQDRLLLLRLDRKSGGVVFEKVCSQGTPR